MEERLKELRKFLNINQQEFSKRLNLGQSTWAMIETGKRTLNERHIKLICAEFKVNEDWLRTGIGEMFSDTDQTILDTLVQEYHLDDLDKKILAGYLSLPEPDRQQLKKALLLFTQSVSAPVSAEEQRRIDKQKELDAYSKELDAEHMGKTLSHSAV